MNVFVLGCNGMAGHMISLYFHERGHTVLGLDRTPSRYVPSVCGDARDTGRIGEIIREGKFHAVINCIGLLNQDAEDNHSMAAFLNGYFPHYLADVTKDSETQVVHMSTDCVFSGRKGAYTEDDLRDGTTFYDRSKALGELEDGKNLTLRNSIVGPDLNENGIGLLNWFMKQEGEVSGYSKVLWTGQTTLQLAKTMEAAIASRAHGLVNAVPDHAISKYELLRLFNRYLRGGEVVIHPCETMVSDKSLKRTRMDFAYPIPGYELMVAELAEWILAHRQMYPQYPIAE